MTYINEHKSITLIDLRKTTMTLFEVLGKVEQYRSFDSMKGMEIYLDGDSKCICAKKARA